VGKRTPQRLYFLSIKHGTANITPVEPFYQQIAINLCYHYKRFFHPIVNSLKKIPLYTQLVFVVSFSFCILPTFIN